MDIQSSSSRIARPDVRPSPLEPSRGTGDAAPARGVGNGPSASPQPLGSPPRAAREAPSLWHLLNAVERAFFQMPGRGPLSYGPHAPAESPGEPTLPGGRLDVRG
jgi:hypothetical protein